MKVEVRGGTARVTNSAHPHQVVSCVKVVDSQCLNARIGPQDRSRDGNGVEGP